MLARTCTQAPSQEQQSGARLVTDDQVFGVGEGGEDGGDCGQIVAVDDGLLRAHEARQPLLAQAAQPRHQLACGAVDARINGPTGHMLMQNRGARSMQIVSWPGEEEQRARKI